MVISVSSEAGLFHSVSLDKPVLTKAFDCRDHPASEVFVTGTFDDWGKTVKLDKKSGNLHEKLVELPQADEKIYYKVRPLCYSSTRILENAYEHCRSVSLTCLNGKCTLPRLHWRFRHVRVKHGPYSSVLHFLSCLKLTISL